LNNKCFIFWQASLAELVPALVSRITREVTTNIRFSLEEKVKETILDSMAEVVATYFPKPSRATGDRPISDIFVNRSRLTDLRTFLKNPKAEFSCPEQAILLEMMIQRKQSILGILGTGTGKTTIIMMHAKVYGNGRVTVVVLPLSGLHGDLERRAKALGLRISRWQTKGKFNPNADIVYVSIEHLTFEDFQRFLLSFISFPI
jgi:superfamily II DNA or RNA helicase